MRQDKLIIRIWMHLLCLVLLTAAVGRAADSLATAVPFRKAPTIDGKIEKGEWDQAVRSGPLMRWRRMEIEARHAVGFAGFDKDNLYVAIQSELRPGGLIANKKFNDGRVVFDSAIEIWIDPNRDNRKTGKGDLSYYQIIGNSLGTRKDVKFSLGAPDTGWNLSGEYKNHVDEEAGVWTAEMSIPWSNLGWNDGVKMGRTIGLIIARDYKNPWTQPTWMPLGASFASVGEYPALRLTEAEPVVRIDELRHDTFMGETPLQVKVLNPGKKARKAKVDLLITSTDMPKLEKTEELTIPASGSVDFEYKITKGRLHERAQHTLNLVVTDADNGDVLFRLKGMKWQKAPAKKWHVRTGPNPAAAAKVGYYPSNKVVKAWITPVELGKDFAETRSAEIKITDAAGETVLAETFTWDKGNTGLAKYTLPDIDDGKYQVSIQIKGFDKPMIRHFVDRTFPWENNALGITTEIYPPFEPIKRNVDQVDVVMRKYKQNGIGLWSSVQAKGNETDYKELLAGPMSVQVSMDSAAVDAPGTALEGAGVFTSTQKHMVVYEGRAAHPAVKVRTRSITEYDGCMRVEMDLLPGVENKELKALWVDIPIKDALAPLYHVTTTALRYNPAGSTPEGDGLIWDTRDFPDGEWPTGFRPYIWLGAEERGLCWFADNDKNWVKDVSFKKGTYAPAFSLHRNKGTLTLRIHLVQKPVTIQRKRHIVFGLMATPAKPMPKDWRAIGRPDHKSFYFSMGHVHGLYSTYASKYPLNYDWATFDLNYARRSGNKELMADARERFKGWAKRNVTERIGKDWRDKMVNLHKLGWKRGAGDPMSVYFEEFHSTVVKGGEEAPAFYTEWTGRPLNEGFFKGEGPWAIHLSTGGLVKSYRDFACWYGAEWLKRGYGLYFDNSFPKKATDPLTTAAYRWRGVTVPSASMWNHRKYLKRIWIMHQQMRDPKAPQAMMIHMTNTQIAPYMVWNEYNLDLEWRNSDDPLQKRFSPDLLRTESLGLKTGTVPVVLGFSGGPAMLVHEIKSGITVKKYPKTFVDFGYGKPDCEVYNYWGENPPVSVSDPDCKWLLLKRDGKLFVYLVTWNGVDAKVKLDLDLKKLGVNVNKVVNAENDEAVTELNGGSFTVDLPGFGVRALRLE